VKIGDILAENQILAELESRDKAGLRRLYAEADAVINVCGYHEIRPEHADIRRLVYLQTDPMAEQVKVALGDEEVLDRLDRHDVHFTYGTGTAGWALPSFGWNIQTPPAPDVNVVDITGGFVVGAFDLYDFSGEPNLLCEYRLIHQYPYTQNPERHVFTLQGPGERCADFDDLPEWDTYHVNDVFRTQGHLVTGREYIRSSGVIVPSGYAEVRSSDDDTGKMLYLSEVSVEFAFDGPVLGVGFAFGETGENINLEINGDLQNVPDFADVNGLAIGGCLVTVTDDVGSYTGTVWIAGQVDQLMVGGHELFIDDVCPLRDNGGTYVATNFRFGHTYGMLDTESLWQFHDWMTISPHHAALSQGEPFELTLDWDSRLPYPASNLLAAAQIPTAPDCTVYLEADLNKDCCVDIADLEILIDQWMECTTFEGADEVTD